MPIETHGNPPNLEEKQKGFYNQIIENLRKLPNNVPADFTDWLGNIYKRKQYKVYLEDVMENLKHII